MRDTSWSWKRQRVSLYEYVKSANECIMANNGRGSRGIAINYDRPTRPHLSSRPSAEGD